MAVVASGIWVVGARGWPQVVKNQGWSGSSWWGRMITVADGWVEPHGQEPGRVVWQPGAFVFSTRRPVLVIEARSAWTRSIVPSASRNGLWAGVMGEWPV